MSVYTEGLLVLVGVNVLMALSVYVMLATDQLSLGNAGFKAVGAYLSAYLTVVSGWDLAPALLAGAVAAAAVGVAVGLPALRLRGIFFVMATLGFGEMTRTFFLNFEPTGGVNGFRGPFGTTLGLVGAVLVVVIGVLAYVESSRLGRSLDAVRDDAEVADSLGLDVAALRIGAVAAGAAVAGAAGALYAHHAFYIESSNFGFLASAGAVLFVIFGGFQTLWGPILGAVVLTLLPEFLRPLADWRLTIYGLLLVLLMIVRPSGLITRSGLRGVGRAIARPFAPRAR